MQAMSSVRGRSRHAFLAALLLSAALMPQTAFAQSTPVERTVAGQTVILQRFTPPQALGTVDIRVEDQRKRVSDADAEGVRIQLRSVSVDGARSLPLEALAPIWQDQLGKTITMAELYRIADAVDAAYLAAGYYSMTVVPVQDFASGRVRLQVYEGYVQRVEITSDLPGIEQRLAPYIDRILAMQPIRVKEAERVLLLMSDLGGLEIEGTFVRPETPSAGGLLKLKVGFSPRSGVISLDNYGSSSVGPLELLASAEFNDLFGRFETTSLLGLTIPDNPQEMVFLQLAQDMPIGHDGLKAGYSLAYIGQKPGGDLSAQDIRIASVIGTGYLSFPFLRSLQQSLVGRAEVVIHNDHVDVMGMPVSRSRVRRAELSLTYDRVLGEGSLSAEAGINFGVVSDLDLGDVPGSYHYLRGSMDYSRPLGEHFSFRVRAAGQYSPTALPASVQFALGGQSYGRAFDAGALMGDSAAAAAVELGHRVDTGLSALPFLSFTAFADYASAWNHETGDVLVQQGLGSYGLTMGGVLNESLLFEVGAALPWTRPEAQEDPGARLFFRMGKAF